jgi:hypothetical protein
VVLPADTWDACVHTNGILAPVLVIVDRQPFWLSAQPGTAETSIHASASQVWDYAYTWGVETTLPAGYIFCSVEDHAGNIWAGGQQEMLQWNGSGWSVADTSPVSVAAGNVRSATRLQNGDILFGYIANVIERSAAGVWSTETAAPAATVYDIIEGIAGEVFAGEQGQIWKRDTDGSWAVDTTLPGDYVYSFCRDRTGRVFAGGTGEILAQSITTVAGDEGTETLEVIVRRETDNAMQYNEAVFTSEHRFKLFNRNIIGFRFALDVPAGAHIEACKIEMMVPNNPITAVGISETLKVYCEATDDATVFATTDNNLSNRTLTTNYVAWQDTDPDRTRHEYFGPPDLAHVLQEVIDRGGWSSGQRVVFLFKCDNLSYSGTDLESARRIFDYRN